MKKLLSLIALVCVFAFSSCSKSDDPTVLSFNKSVYVLLADSPLEITLTASKPVNQSVSIPVNVLGSAVSGEEYQMSSTSFNFTEGSSSASITFTPLNNFNGEKEIVLIVGALPGGFSVGPNSQAVIAVESKEHIIYSFYAEKGDILDNYKMTLTLLGEKSGKNFIASGDIEIPFVFASTSEAIEGVDFEVVGGVKKFIVPKGSNNASVTIASKDNTLGESKNLIVQVDKSALSGRFLQGNIPSTTLAVKGILKLSSLVGTWEFVAVPEIDEFLFWVEDEGDNPDLVPFKNAGFNFDLKEDESGIILKPGSVKGDLSNFLRESKIDYTKAFHTIGGATLLSDNCTQETFMWTSEDINLTYFKLEKANRDFSATSEKLGEATVALRINNDGNLELHLRDYNKPPFMGNWWDENKWDSDMFGFCYIFKKK